MQCSDEDLKALGFKMASRILLRNLQKSEGKYFYVIVSNTYYLIIITIASYYFYF